MTAPDPAALHARITALALLLPEASETASHGSPAWKVADKKMFAYFWHDHHGDGITALLVKTSGLEEQAMLIEADPDIYYPPALCRPLGLDRRPPRRRRHRLVPHRTPPPRKLAPRRPPAGWPR